MRLTFRTVRLLLALLSVTVAVLGLSAAVGPAAARADVPVNFGPIDHTNPFAGNVYQPSQAVNATCPDTVLTGVTGNKGLFPEGDPNFGKDGWLAGIDPHCTTVKTD